MSKKIALGRGLGALMGESTNYDKPRMENTNELDIDQIEVNPYQPRKQFDEESLNELAASITQLGIIQPITVRKMDNNHYQIISGERRYRAAKMAGLSSIPAFIRTADDQSMIEMALVENIQREDLDAIEIAVSYQRLIEEINLTQETLSERVGKKRSTITNYLRLLKLPATIQLGIRTRQITMGHARALIGMEDIEKQMELYQRIILEDLSVRRVEELVKHPEESLMEDPPAGIKVEKNHIPHEYSGLQYSLSGFFNSKIQFKRNPKGDGKIVIPFRSDEDLERIIEIFDKLK